ncbi:hypothetical protein [Streptomyces graminilatus]|uniref:hypothetical protein n=1 Tax=Streptomyces graminilatus TaxID=1464070 RepID=UPI0006E348DF|nr:hypothetical protein [Streptomyces graminilatus]
MRVSPEDSARGVALGRQVVELVHHRLDPRRVSGEIERFPGSAYGTVPRATPARRAVSRMFTRLSDAG